MAKKPNSKLYKDLSQWLDLDSLEPEKFDLVSGI